MADGDVKRDQLFPKIENLIWCYDIKKVKEKMKYYLIFVNQSIAKTSK